MPASKLLQNRIGWYAARAGLPDDALAARAGITRAHLNRLKNGHVVPRVRTAIAVARALHVSIAELFHLRRA
jgi:DNA-binding XRE family transcriptional regulator